MPFAKGNQLGKANAGRKRDTSKKTVWIMESLREQGYDYERTLVNFLERAARGDKLAYDMAALLIKLVPHLANQPKHDVGIAQVDTLVINRYEAGRPAGRLNEPEAELQSDAAKVSAPVDTTAVEGEEGQGPTVTSITDAEQ